MRALLPRHATVLPCTPSTPPTAWLRWYLAAQPSLPRASAWPRCAIARARQWANKSRTGLRRSRPASAATRWRPSCSAGVFRKLLDKPLVSYRYIRPIKYQQQYNGWEKEVTWLNGWPDLVCWFPQLKMWHNLIGGVGMGDIFLGKV